MYSVFSDLFPDDQAKVLHLKAHLFHDLRRRGVLSGNASFSATSIEQIFMACARHGIVVSVILDSVKGGTTTHTLD